MSPQNKVRLSLTPARITIFYYIFLGGLWILFSDLLLSSFAPTLAWLTLFQTFKGWFFVIVTGSLLYGLIKYYAYERTKAENDLRNSHGQLVSILDGINDGFITLDRDLKYTSVNRRAGILLNHTPKECIGKYFWDIFPDAHDNQVRKTMEDALQSLQPVEFECFDASAQRWFENRVYPSKDGLTIFFQDITQQKEAEAERQLQLAIIDKTSDIVGLATPDGMLTYLNRAGIELIVFNPAEDGTKKNITEFHPRWASDILFSTGLPTAAAKGLWKGELAIFDSSGIEVPVSQLIMSHRTPNGTLTYFSSIIREITDLKLKEEALRGSEEKFSKAFQASPNAMVITRVSDNIIIDVNDSFIRASGYGYEEVVGKTTIDLNLWREQSDRKMFLAQLTREGSVTKHIFYFQHKLGDIRCGSISGETIHIGTEKCYLSVIEDITDQKNIEEELRVSRDFALAIIDSLPGIFYIYNPQNNSVTWNKTFKEITGYTDDEIKSMAFLGEFAEEDRDKLRNGLAEILRDGSSSSTDARLLTKDGKQVLFHLTGTRLNMKDEKYIIGMGIDITSRKNAEDLIRQVNERLQYLLTATSVVIYTASVAKAHAVTFVSDNVINVTGFSSDEFLSGENFWCEQIHPEDRKQTQNDLDSLITKGSNTYEYRFRQKDGRYTWIREECKLVRDANGTPKEIIGYFTDISKRKEVEQALKFNEERLRLALEATSDALWDWDLSTNTLYYSPRWYTMLGYEPQSFEANYENWVRLTMPEDVERTVRILRDAIENGVGFESEFRMKAADGSWRWILGRGRATAWDAQGKALRLTGTNTDMTERREAENALRMSRDQLRNYGARLQHIREEERTYIAREIHDELGQILTGLKMDLSFLEEILLEEARLTQRREVRAKIDSMSNLMDSAIGSMRKIITELRPVVLDTMGLSAAIEWQAEEFQQRTGIACFYTSPQDMPTLPRDFATSIFRILQESLTNIIRHAGASRTTITMKLDQGNLILLVHDDGRGISEDEIAQKKSFGITGMKERVELLGGKFNIHGIQGKGTLLSVEIPLPSQQA